MCKYIAKIDEQNYVVIDVDGEGQLVSRVTYLHNTKISSCKKVQDKERTKKHYKKNDGRVLTRNEMQHVILRYPEIITNLKFIKVSTMPLEYRSGVIIRSENVQGTQVKRAVTFIYTNILC